MRCGISRISVVKPHAPSCARLRINDEPSGYQLFSVDTANAQWFRAYRYLHFIDAARLRSVDTPGATGKCESIRLALATREELPTILEEAKEAHLQGLVIIVHCR